VDWLPLSERLASAGCQGLLVAPRPGQRAPHRPQTAVHDCPGLPRLPRLGLLTAAGRPAEPSRVGRASQRQRARLSAAAGRPLQRREHALEQRHGQLPAGGSALTGLTGRRRRRALGRGDRAQPLTKPPPHHQPSPEGVVPGKALLRFHT
jgi:hypothetical protein